MSVSSGVESVLFGYLGVSLDAPSSGGSVRDDTSPVEVTRPLFSSVGSLLTDGGNRFIFCGQCGSAQCVQASTSSSGDSTKCRPLDSSDPAPSKLASSRPITTTTTSTSSVSINSEKRPLLRLPLDVCAGLRRVGKYRSADPDAWHFVLPQSVLLGRDGAEKDTDTDKRMYPLWAAFKKPKVQHAQSGYNNVAMFDGSKGTGGENKVAKGSGNVDGNDIDATDKQNTVHSCNACADVIIPVPECVPAVQKHVLSMGYPGYQASSIIMSSPGSGAGDQTLPTETSTGVLPATVLPPPFALHALRCNDSTCSDCQYPHFMYMGGSLFWQQGHCPHIRASFSRRSLSQMFARANPDGDDDSESAPPTFDFVPFPFGATDVKIRSKLSSLKMCQHVSEAVYCIASVDGKFRSLCSKISDCMLPHPLLAFILGVPCWMCPSKDACFAGGLLREVYRTIQQQSGTDDSGSEDFSARVYARYHVEPPCSLNELQLLFDRLALYQTLAEKEKVGSGAKPGDTPNESKTKFNFYEKHPLLLQSLSLAQKAQRLVSDDEKESVDEAKCPETALGRPISRHRLAEAQQSDASCHLHASTLCSCSPKRWTSAKDVWTVLIRTSALVRGGGVGFGIQSSKAPVASTRGADEPAQCGDIVILAPGVEWGYAVHADQACREWLELCIQLRS